MITLRAAGGMSSVSCIHFSLPDSRRQYVLPGLNSRRNLSLGFPLRGRTIVISFFGQSIT